MTPLVSICVLTYNHEKYVAQMLNSMLAQKTDFPFEILIHDDASTDGTSAILKDYAKKYPDIVKPLFEEENQFSKSPIKNISGIYNFPRAQGKYIAMCEGDDYWTCDTKLKQQVEYMEAHPECTLCFHSANQINDGVMSKAMMRPYNESRVVSPEEIINKKSGYPTASLMMRADLMKALPEFYMQAPIGDIPMQLTMAAAGYGYYIDSPMCAYRYFTEGSWSRDMFTGEYKEKQLRYRDQMLKMYDQFDEFTKGSYHKAVTKAKNRIKNGCKINLTYLWIKKLIKK